MAKAVVFVQGGGAGAYDADAVLAKQLQDALGAGYEIHYPRLSLESDPDLRRWGKEVADVLDRLQNAVLVGHSLGGAVLLHRLTHHALAANVEGLYLLAAPARDSNEWDFEDLALPDNAAAMISKIPALVFYHCQDDESVPFAHLDRHRKVFPQATFRAFESGGHQFENRIRDVANDVLSSSGVA